MTAPHRVPMPGWAGPDHNDDDLVAWEAAAEARQATATPGVHRLVDVAFRWGGWVGGCSCGRWWWTSEPTRAALAAAHREVHVEAVTRAVAS